MQIGQVTLMVRNLHQGIYLLLQKELYYGSQNCRSVFALSTTKTEYITANEASKEMLWLKQFLQELGLKQDGYVVNCDGQSAIDLSKNSMNHSRSKHIEVRYNWLRLVIK